MKNQQLLNLLSDYYAVYLKTHSYHWNVTGENFISLHEMLEDQYKGFAKEIDQIAECIRMLDEKVPISLSNIVSLTKISEPNENLTSLLMLKDLHESNAYLLEKLNETFKIYSEQNNILIENLITNLVTTRQKDIWMLKASL